MKKGKKNISHCSCAMKNNSCWLAFSWRNGNFQHETTFKFIQSLNRFLSIPQREREKPGQGLSWFFYILRAVIYGLMTLIYNFLLFAPMKSPRTTKSISTFATLSHEYLFIPAAQQKNTVLSLLKLNTIVQGSVYLRKFPADLEKKRMKALCMFPAFPK